MKTHDLEPGDVLFYRTTLGTDPSGTQSIERIPIPALGSSFPALAAFIQGAPHHFVDGDHRPWYHVGVYLGSDVVAGYPFDVSSGELVDPVIKGQPLDLAELARFDVEVQVLRDPDPERRSLVATKADGQVTASLDYSLRGLLGFALASVAGITPESLARDRLRTQARGASSLARKQASDPESCVTSVAKVIEDSAGSALTYSWPPILPADFLYGAVGQAARAIVDQAVKDMRYLVERGSLGADLVAGPFEPDLALAMAASLCPPEELAERYPNLHDLGRRDRIEPAELGVDGLVPPTPTLPGINEMLHAIVEPFMGGSSSVPGFVTVALAYTKGIELLGLGDWDALLTEGTPLKGRPLTSEDFMLSPAMLWEALVGQLSYMDMGLLEP